MKYDKKVERYNKQHWKAQALKLSYERAETPLVKRFFKKLYLQENRKAVKLYADINKFV